MKAKSQSIIVAGISTILFLVLGALALTFIGSPVVEAQTGAPAAQPARTITVVGEGKVKAAPDIAQISIGIEMVGEDVKQTSNEAATAMETLLAALQAQGIAENDIQTSYYNIWVERPYGPDNQPSGQAIYHVNNNVNVIVRELDNLATVLSAAIEAGANNINSVSFNLSDPEQLRSQAREQAVDNAMEKAQELAQLNGVQVGQVISINETVNQGLIPFAEAAQGVGGAGPIAPGQVEVTAQLEVTYEIQ